LTYKRSSSDQGRLEYSGVKQVSGNFASRVKRDFAYDTTSSFFSLSTLEEMPRPGGKPYYSPHKRARISTEYLLGQPAKVVAIKYGCPTALVYKIAKRSKGQISCRSHPKSGRPHALSEADKIAIKRYINLDPFIQTRALREQSDVAASETIIRKFLAQEGIFHTWAKQRPFIT
jgi:hypothetical protein